MKSNKFNLSVLTSVCAALLVLAFAGSSMAQGRYANVYSRSDVNGFIGNLENSSDEFRTNFRREMDNSSLSSSNKRQFNNTVASFEDSVDRLRRNFDGNNNWWASRSQVQNMMSSARPVNVMMNSIAFRRRIEREWNQLRRDINKLADTYDLNDLNGSGGNWGGGGGPNPGWGNPNAPNWAVGTFYTNDPSGGGTITLTVDRNGNVRSSLGSETGYATMYGDRLYMDGVEFRVTRNGNGIRTRRVDNGVVANYTRNYPGGGGGGGIGNPYAPNWAIGTFYTRDPSTGGTIVLTVDRNGNVTSSLMGGEVGYAKMYGETMYMDGVEFRVTRNGNGIRTRRVDNGVTANYSRNRPR